MRHPILVGFAADLLAGDPQRGHPVAAFGQAAAALERRTYADRRAAGVAHVAALVGAAAAFGRLVRLDVAVWAVLGGRSLGREASVIADLVEAGDIDGARRRIPSLVGRDPAGLDADGLCRAALESVAENTVDAVVAPLLWAAAARTPGALAYRAINTLDAMIGHHSPRYEQFGWAAARLDDVATWPAARLTAVLTVALAPLVGGDARAAQRIWFRDAAAHPSPNAGRAEAAFAGALGVRLGGPVSYAARSEDRPWLGDGRAPTPADVRRAVTLARLVGSAAALLAAAGAARTGSGR